MKQLIKVDRIRTVEEASVKMKYFVPLISLLIFTASINSCLNPKEEVMQDEFVTLKVNHYPDGTTKEEWKVYPDDSSSGRYLKFNQAGWLAEEHWYVDNKREGPFIKYHSNGEISEYSTYINERKMGDAYKYDSTGNVVTYSFHYGSEKPLFLVDYIDNHVENELRAVYFDLVNNQKPPTDSGHFEGDIIYVRPPNSKLRITLTETDKNDSVTQRIELPMDTFSYRYTKDYEGNMDLKFSVECQFYDSVLQFSDTTELVFNAGEE